MLSHPYGVKPWGNYLTSGVPEELEVRAKGLGPLLSRLQDERVLEILGCLEAADLARLSRVSRALYVFAHHHDLWKAVTLLSLLSPNELATAGCGCGGGSGEGPLLRYHAGGWKETYLRERVAGIASSTQQRIHVPLMVQGMYSDALYQPVALSNWRPKSQWLARDNCPRLHKPTLEEFRRLHEEPNTPVLITGVVHEWPGFTRWNQGGIMQGLQQDAGGAETTFHGGGLSFTLSGYWDYATAQTDDLPLYIFDRRFADKCPCFAAGYSPHLPPYFQEDYFATLGESERPDHRWLIMGPARSGSSFHKDPNNTSAWNAVISGRKKWILLPPDVTPPGVHPSADGLDLATPVTLAEWFNNFYREASKLHPPPVECVAGPGDLMFVPRGWWHLVLNLEDSVAITQNYVSRVGLPHVLTFLDEQRHLISGLPDHKRSGLYERFVEAMQANHPEVLAVAQEQRKSSSKTSTNKRKAEDTIDGDIDTADATAAGGGTEGGRQGVKKRQEGGLLSSTLSSNESEAEAGASFGFRFDFGGLDMAG